MTKEQIEKLMEGVTKGPWEAVRKSVRVFGSGDEFGAPTGGAGGICNTLGAGYGGGKNNPVNVQAERNACFIAALPDIAKTALDALHWVEELEKELGERCRRCACTHQSACDCSCHLIHLPIKR